MKNEKQIILISACLLGSKVRYDGQAKEYKNIRKLLDYYDIIPICPEVDGGLKIPRPKAEIVGNKVMNEKVKMLHLFLMMEHIKLYKWHNLKMLPLSF